MTYLCNRTILVKARAHVLVTLAARLLREGELYRESGPMLASTQTLVLDLTRETLSR